jgi:hypothetical protein
MAYNKFSLRMLSWSCDDILRGSGWLDCKWNIF